MSIITWFTGGTFESNLKDADSLFDNKEYGEAKLTYQRALKKQKDVPSSEIEHIKKRVEQCSFYLAEARVDNSKKYFNSGDIETAFTMLDDALDISSDPQIKILVDETKKTFEIQTEKEVEESSHEMSDDDILAVISGTWTFNQAEEYASMPEIFMQGLIYAHDNKIDDSIKCILSAIEQKPNALLPRLELAKLFTLIKKYDEAEENIKLFLNKAHDDHVDERVAAYTLMAQLYIEKKDFKEAEAALMSAYKAAPDNHASLLNLGLFLREQKEYKRSKTTLKNALDIMGSLHPDMRVPRELGLTCLAMGDKKEAKDYLASCIEYWNSTGEHDKYDPEVALPLASLYEEEGELEKACNLFRHLCTGYDNRNFFHYNIESARLLFKLPDMESVAQQYANAAKKLASTDEEYDQVAKLNSMQI